MPGPLIPDVYQSTRGIKAPKSCTLPSEIAARNSGSSPLSKISPNRLSCVNLCELVDTGYHSTVVVVLSADRMLTLCMILSPFVDSASFGPLVVSMDPVAMAIALRAQAQASNAALVAAAVAQTATAAAAPPKPVTEDEGTGVAEEITEIFSDYKPSIKIGNLCAPQWYPAPPSLPESLTFRPHGSRPVITPQ